MLFCLADTPIPMNWAEYGIVALIAGTMLVSLLWFMRHVVTVTIPKSQETHATTIDKMVITHAEAVKGMATAYVNDQKEARAMFLTLLTQERETCERRHKESKEEKQQMHTENKQLHLLSLEGIKETRHTVNNIGQLVSAHHAVVDVLIGIQREEAKGNHS